MKKKLFSLFLVVNIFSNILFSQIYSTQQTVLAGHWIYDALYSLALENKQSLVLDNAPLTIGELELNYYSLKKDNLSDTGKLLCEKIEAFFARKKYLFDFNGARFTTNIILNPQGSIKTNGDVDWSYATSYTDNGGYTSTTVSGSKYMEPLLTMPFILDFGQLAYISVEPYAGAGPFWALTSDFYSTNIPTGKNGSEFFMWPINGDASIGYNFEKWGINLHVGRQGLEIGRTKTGSLIYNHTFQSDFYSQLNLYSTNLRYTMDVTQIEENRYVYVHSAEIVPFKWLKMGITEGTLIDGQFELRYLNPLLFMHAFSGWKGYKTEEEDKIYKEAHYCAYFALSFDIIPCKNLRVYGLYSQNEIQSSVELNTDEDYSYPDSLGFQLGVEVTVPSNLGGYFNGYLEGIYTTPFHYLKQTHNNSLSRVRTEIDGKGGIGSWIGSPFGPDAAGFETGIGYNDYDRFKTQFKYLFVAHGTNSFALYNKKSEDKKYDMYYPMVMYRNGYTANTTVPMARTYALTNTVQYTNTITLTTEYKFIKNLKGELETSYIFIFNNHSIENNYAHGLECNLGFRYELF